MFVRPSWAPVYLGCAVLLVACGGGGSGGGGGLGGFAPPAAGSGGGGASGSGGASTPGSGGAAGSGGTAAASTVLSGRVTYESVPSANGVLDYGAVARKPVRGVPLDVVDAAGNVKASATTDADGRYSVTVAAGGPVAVRVLAKLVRGSGSGSADVAVRDNTQSGGIHGIQTNFFALGGATATRDINAASGWTGSAYGSDRLAAPFAVLDAIYAAQSKVLSTAAGTVFPPLDVYWSPDNRPAGGAPELGQIGTSHFEDRTRSGGGRSIYVLGQENVDTDEYDTSVIAHEWGHYYQSAFSRDDSPGGPHSTGDLADRRLAFSEGWGNAWSGIALGRRDYSDSAGPRQSQGFAFALDTGAPSTPGWYKEFSVQSVLWNLNNQIGFTPIHQAMTQGLKNTPAVTSIHAFASAFIAVASSAQQAALNSLLAGQRITGSSDAFGGSETNDGGLGAFALPLYTSAAVGTPKQVCVTDQADPGGSGNKLGSFAYLRLPISQARDYTVNVSGPAGSDPDFRVYQGALVGGAANVQAGSDQAKVKLGAGTAVVAVQDFNVSSANTCFTVTVN
ncbi:carboxypeptidase-like regulatory domain-containing protein [Pseudacidovorax intermedius]|uniref:Lipoprotein n=1 Tax=Pseudacidovorax intermedius TaxID=433924 RepID=A0A147GPC6_9BURK|nr:carboxypeptidase-like regulatory domain-containing protein [Pseudacidovorax intermedius]KTT15800.1 hypothetical protein NS331_19800 [Pseudacidovorax intermedius]